MWLCSLAMTLAVQFSVVLVKVLIFDSESYNFTVTLVTYWGEAEQAPR